jgi:hypothetical protein
MVGRWLAVEELSSAARCYTQVSRLQRVDPMKQSFTKRALLVPATAADVVGVDRSAIPGPIAIR